MMISVMMREGASLPSYQSKGAAGADVSAFLSSPITIAPGERALIPTGLFLEIPEGFEVQVRPRSGLAMRHGITVLNAPGTIDSDYRGELSVLLVNLSGEDFTINPGDRIAQLVVARVERASFLRSESLGSTDRGVGGFGSTGV